MQHHRQRLFVLTAGPEPKDRNVLKIDEISFIMINYHANASSHSASRTLDYLKKKNSPYDFVEFFCATYANLLIVRNPYEISR